MKSLWSSGVGVKSKYAEVITSDKEDQLWERNFLNVDTPLGLLQCVFFYNWKCFCLRGGQQHRDLKLSQLVRCQKPDRYEYNENTSKNHEDGLLELRLEHKSVPVFTNPSAGSRCHVFLLDLYIRKLPRRHLRRIFSNASLYKQSLLTLLGHGLRQFHWGPMGQPTSSNVWGGIPSDSKEWESVRLMFAVLLSSFYS